MQKHSNNYLPALDGIRALSILLVLLAHIGFDTVVPGGLGVTIFFYVSGLLITNLLLIEYKKNNSINFKDFYIRRVLRLYPPILFMLLVTLSIPILNKTVKINELFAALFYYENYFTLYHFEAMKNIAGLDFFWSLSVEEHFYLVFPFLFLLLIKFPKKLVAAVVTLTALSLANRFYIALVYNASEFSGAYAYSATTCRIDSILAGCLSSIILRLDYKGRYINFVTRKPVFISALAILIFSLVFRNEFFRQTVRYSLQNISFMVIIPSILYSQGYKLINKLFSFKPLVFVGKLSYSLYLFHQAAYMLVDAYITPYGKTFSYIFCSMLVAFLLALISYELVEKPVMRLRKKFGSDVRVSVNDAGFVAQG